MKRQEAELKFRIKNARLPGGGKEEDHRGFIDVVKGDMQRVGVTKEDDRDRVR